MYVVAPALPPPYKWLQIPLSALHTDRWPGYLSTWPIRQGGSNQMFSGELKAFLRGSGVRNTTHWPLVFLATATVVTSAVALYYYASTHGYDATGIDLRYYLSLLTPQELGLVPTFSSGLFEHGEYDDDVADGAVRGNDGCDDTLRKRGCTFFGSAFRRSRSILE